MYILSIVAVLLIGVFAWQQVAQSLKKRKKKNKKNNKKR